MGFKQDEEIFTSKFESHWVPPSKGFVPYLGRNLSKLLVTPVASISMCFR